MKTLKVLLILSLLFLLFATLSASGQSRTNRLYRPCSGSATPATVEVQRDGDINLVPCLGRQTLINGTGGTLISNGSPEFGGNPIVITSGSAPVRIGDTALTSEADNYFEVHSEGNHQFTFYGLGTSTLFQANVQIDGGLFIAFPIRYTRTVTAAGITGAQTINKPSGTVNFAAGTGAVGIVVTNSNVLGSSIVHAVARTDDATCSVKSVVSASGSFTIRMTANCTAETSVGFLITQ